MARLNGAPTEHLVMAKYVEASIKASSTQIKVTEKSVDWQLSQSLSVHDEHGAIEKPMAAEWNESSITKYEMMSYGLNQSHVFTSPRHRRRGNINQTSLICQSKLEAHAVPVMCDRLSSRSSLAELLHSPPQTEVFKQGFGLEIC